MIVRFEVSDTERAKREIGFSQWNTFFRNDENGRLFMQISKDEIPLLNSFLVEKGVSVSGITYQRSLEDYFLKLTHQV